MSLVTARLAELGIVLPTPAKPLAAYVPTVRTGNQVFVSGQVPIGPQGIEFVGKLGATMDIETGAKAARLCAINLLAQMNAHLDGDLERITRCVKLVGFVNATLDFADHPKVINGASELIGAVLGEKGQHARSAVGVGSLPFGVSVEVEAIFEIA